MWRLRAGWGYNIDAFTHHLPLPRKWQGRICDWYEVRYLGVTEDELEFVRNA